MSPPFMVVVAAPSNKRVVAVGGKAKDTMPGHVGIYSRVTWTHLNNSLLLFTRACSVLPPARIPLQLSNVVCITFRSTSVVLSLGKDAAVAFPLREKDIK